MTPVTVTEVADELYALPPAEFVAARDDRARAARAGGQRDEAAAIRRLVRPTASAWLVNQLSRREPDQISRLVAVGEALAEAQRSLAGDRLRELSAERRQVISDLLPAAEIIARQAGQPASANVLGEVRATLEAALADAGAREAVRSGSLTRALTYAGLGEVDLTAALALPGRKGPRDDGRAVTRRHGRGSAGSGPGTTRPADDGAPSAARAGREVAVHQAQAAAAAADRDLADAAQRLRAIEEQSRFLRRRVEHLERELRQARTEESELSGDVQRAIRARDAAARKADRASRDLTRAGQQAGQG